MIKQKKLYLTAILCWAFLASPLHASNFWDYSDIKQFPLQQSVVEPITQTWIKPVEMTSWGIGKSYVYYHKNLSSIFSLQDPKFRFRPSYVYEVKRDFSFGKSSRSFGMDITLFVNPLHNRVIDFDSQFPYLRGCDILSNYKFKKHASTRIGDIVGIIVPKIGIVAVLEGCLDHEKRMYYPMGLGVAGGIGIGIGIDYYPSQWLGMFIEGSIKCNRIISGLLAPIEESTAYPTGYTYQKNSYYYYPIAITCGFKTTF